MQTLFNIILGFHITGGTVALISGLVAMLTDKGGKSHRWFGKFYFWGMTAACGSSLYLAIAHPNMFLFMIGVFSYQLVAIGYRSLWLKQLTKGNVKPKFADWLIGLAAGVFNVALISWGAYEIANDRLFGVTGLVFGGVGLVNSYRWMKQFFVLPTDKRHWLYSHFQAMGGGYIATATAFLVVNVNFLPSLVLWLGPGVIGAVIITFTTAGYKRKFQKSKPVFKVREVQESLT